MSKWNELIAEQKAERIDLVQKALDEHKTKTKAANSLGITRQQLYQFMRQHKLQIVARKYVSDLTKVVEEISPIITPKRKRETGYND